jgi:hypothetical protein
LPGSEAEPKRDRELAYRALMRALKEGRYEDGLALSRLALALKPNDSADHVRFETANTPTPSGQVN